MQVVKPSGSCPEVYRLNSSTCGKLPVTAVRFLSNATSSKDKENILLATCENLQQDRVPHTMPLDLCLLREVLLRHAQVSRYYLSMTISPRSLVALDVLLVKCMHFRCIWEFCLVAHCHWTSIVLSKRRRPESCCSSGPRLREFLYKRLQWPRASV